MKTSRQTSKVWKHFTKDGAPIGKAKCTLCGTVIATTNSNTSNMKAHLRSFHVSHFLSLDSDNAPARTSAMDVEEVEQLVEEEGLIASGAASAAASGSSSESSRDLTSPAASPARPTSRPGSAASTSSATATIFTPPSSPVPPSPGAKSRRSVSPAGGVQTNLDGYRVPSTKVTDQLHMYVTHYIVSCNRTLNTVEKPGFQKMLTGFRPGYKIMTRRALTDKHVPELEKKVKGLIKTLLKDAGVFAITSDNWTSTADVPYTSLTAHFIDKLWNLHAITLACRASHIAHTGINLKDFFSDELASWDLKICNVSAATTDNAAEMRVAVESLDIDHMRCLGHTLQNGVTDLLQQGDVREAHAASKRFLHWISTSKVLRAYKAFVLQRYKKEPLEFPSTSPTRWWSELKLFERVVQSNDLVREFAASYDRGRHLHKVPGSTTIFVLRAVIKSLKPIEDICTKLSGDSYVTICAVLPIVHLLETGFEDDDDNMNLDDLNMAEQGQLDLEALKPATLRSFICKKLSKRYCPDNWHEDEDPAADEDGNEDFGAEPLTGHQRIDRRSAIRCHKLLVKCSFLDPRFKDELTRQEQELAIKLLEEEFKAGCEDPNAPAPNSSVAPNEVSLSSLFAKKRRTGPAPAGVNQDRAPIAGGANADGADGGGSSSSGSGAARPSALQAFQAELRRYRDIPNVSMEEQVLKWWKERADTYSSLSEMARKYLAIPATSTTSERLFSVGGNVVTDSRECLTDEHSEQLITLSCNQHLFL